MVGADEETLFENVGLAGPVEVLRNGYVIVVGQHYISAEHRWICSGIIFYVRNGFGDRFESGQDLCIQDGSGFKTFRGWVIALGT